METTKAVLWQDFVRYGDDRPMPQTLIENERVRVIIAGLNPGQGIPLHPEAAAVYHILEGKGAMTVDGKNYAIQQGSVIVADEGAVRGMQAENHLVFMAVRLA